MDPRVIIPLAPESPWASWARPDIHHCEANGPGWITAPADTWSNLAYVLVAAWIWKRRDEPNAKALAWLVLGMGVTSFVFHASYTFFFQVFDYAGMFFYSSWILALGLRRAGVLGEKQRGIFFWTLSSVSVACVVLFRKLGWPIQPVFGIQAVSAAALECWLYARTKTVYSIKPLLASMGLVAAAFTFWNLDHTDWFCRPDDHLIQGHAIWHLLTAASFVAAFRYFRQF